jgi:hypothetical protein
VCVRVRVCACACVLARQVAFAVQRTNTNLEKLSAKRFYAYGEGDEAGSIEDDFDAWHAGLCVSPLRCSRVCVCVWLCVGALGHV